MPLITLPEPKYPLTESEKQWLKQKEILDEVSEVCYTVGSCEDCYAKESCYLWPNDYRDAAEFEARVAAKLATMICDRFCADILNNKVCCRGHDDRSGMYACRLKRARLAVEEEMEPCTK